MNWANCKSRLQLTHMQHLPLVRNRLCQWNHGWRSLEFMILI